MKESNEVMAGGTYVPPQLVVYGDISELTQGGHGFAFAYGHNDPHGRGWEHGHKVMGRGHKGPHS